MGKCAQNNCRATLSNDEMESIKKTMIRMVLGLTFQNYRKTQIASRALQITVFMQHTFK